MAVKIAITGGKGGVGKSTFSVLLVNKLVRQAKKVVLVDCDVECPNDYLLLSQKLKKPFDKVFANFPKLIKEKCHRCGLCVKKCLSHAIFQPANGYPIFLHELCSSCGLCWKLCPYQAIKIEKKITAEVFKNKINNHFYLLTGRAKAMVEETGPIVTKVREVAEQFAREVRADYLLLDAAAGMHCNVIRALIDVDLAYAVSESTPLGAHDLKLILRLLQKLAVPVKIVLNQANLGNRKPIDEIIHDFGVKMGYEIPYSRKVVLAYSKGKLERINIL